MGQYYKGSKIGTCESMYYLRLEQAQKLAEQGERDDDGIKFEEYLKDNATMFRFPFPKEDGLTQAELLAIPNYQPSFSIPASCLKDLEHRDICISNSFDGGGNNVNIFLPCPYSEKFKNMGIRTSHGGAGGQFIDVIMQAMRGGEEKTIFKCSRCGSMFRLDSEDVEKVKAEAIKYYETYKKPENKLKEDGYENSTYLYAMEIIKRIK